MANGQLFIYLEYNPFIIGILFLHISYFTEFLVTITG